MPECENRSQNKLKKSFGFLGLGTNVVFVDGGNTFRLYDISTIAQSYDLDPGTVLEKIFISRAFTAYQLTSLVLERLQKAIDTYNSKLVILSNLAQLYLDKDVPKKEAKEGEERKAGQIFGFIPAGSRVIPDQFPLQ